MIHPSTSPNPPDLPNNEDSIHTLFSSKPKSSSRFHDPASDLIEDENNVNDDYYHLDEEDDNFDEEDEEDNENEDEDNENEDEEDENEDEEDENEDETNWEKEDFFVSPEIDD